MAFLRIIRRMVLWGALLLAAASLVLWAISYFSYDRITLPLFRGHRLIAGSASGEIQMGLILREGRITQFPLSFTHLSPREYSRLDMHGFAGVYWVRWPMPDLSSSSQFRMIDTVYMLRFSYWLIFLVSGAVAFFCRRRKVPPGICRGCGYDLRASTGRCPECGLAIADAASPAR